MTATAIRKALLRHPRIKRALNKAANTDGRNPREYFNPPPGIRLDYEGLTPDEAWAVKAVAVDEGFCIALSSMVTVRVRLVPIGDWPGESDYKVDGASATINIKDVFTGNAVNDMATLGCRKTEAWDTLTHKMHKSELVNVWDDTQRRAAEEARGYFRLVAPKAGRAGSQ
jgi:hypothetical protein